MIHRKPVASSFNGHLNGSASYEKVTQAAKPLNGNGKISNAQGKNKYRHIAAVHSRARTSCLSHDSDASPSFLGFRNLMVLVLSGSPLTDFRIQHYVRPANLKTRLICPHEVVMNLRLVVENFMKVCTGS